MKESGFMTTNNEVMTENVEATFSMLAMSMASSAVMAMGLSPDPSTGKTQADKHMARFNIDLLAMLKDKTKNNLTIEESDFLTQLLQDLQMKFLQIK